MPMSALRVLTIGITVLPISGGSDDEENTQDEISSHTSEEDGSMVKVKKELENAERPVAGAPLMRDNEASVYWFCTHRSLQGERVLSKHFLSPSCFFIFPSHLLQTMSPGRRKGYEELFGCLEQETAGTDWPRCLQSASPSLGSDAVLQLVSSCHRTGPAF